MKGTRNHQRGFRFFNLQWLVAVHPNIQTGVGIFQTTENKSVHIIILDSSTYIDTTIER